MQFNKMIEECHQERANKEWLKKTSLKNRCENEYALFSVWCRINEIEPTEESFNKYIQAENKTFDFWENKYVYENYFNYEFSYDFNNNKWHCNKK